MSKRIITALVLLAIGGFFLFGLSPVLAQSYDFGSQSGLNQTAAKAGFSTDQEASTIEDIVSLVIYALLGLLGVIFFGLVLYGGFTWMTADGNEEKIKKANKIVMGSLLGLIIVIASYALSYFFINYFWQ